MGCDIHSFAEVKRNNKWEKVEESIFPEYKDQKSTEPFNWRSYSMFAFLAGVRNYDHCEPLSEPKGLPKDSEWLNGDSGEGGWYGGSEVITRLQSINESEYHSKSHLTLKELLDFDYEKTFWNRRISKTTYREDGSVSGVNGAALAEEGEVLSYRENLGEGFFEQIEVLKTLGKPEDVRIVFWFDN